MACSSLGALEPALQMKIAARVDAEALPGKVFLNARHAEFAAKAGMVPDAERGFHMPDVVSVDPDIGHVEAPGKPKRPADILRPDRAAEAIRRVVGDGQRVNLTLIGMDHQDGPEHFLASDPPIHRGAE